MVLRKRLELAGVSAPAATPGPRRTRPKLAFALAKSLIQPFLLVSVLGNQHFYLPPENLLDLRFERGEQSFRCVDGCVIHVTSGRIYIQNGLISYVIGPLSPDPCLT